MQKYIPDSKQSWDSIVESHYGSHGDHNPRCAIIESKQCSTAMSEEVPAGMKPLCLWHHARMASTNIIKCACGEHVCCNGDATGRTIYRNYHDSWNMSVIDGVGTYCCGTCQNSGNHVAKCGDMYVCDEHLENHKKTSLRMKDKEDEENKEDEEDEKDGPVKVLPPGVYGSKKGNGYEVDVAHARGNVHINGYVDAMKLYLWDIQDNKENSARRWLIIASHMLDRPSYVIPIEVEGLIHSSS